MYFHSKRVSVFEASFLLLLVCSSLDSVKGILNDRAVVPITRKPSSAASTVQNSQEGQVYHETEHDKVSRAEVVRSARKRRLELPFSSTAASPGACECMDYWECVSNNGDVYSYCGISDTDVCCFHNKQMKGQPNNNESVITSNNDTAEVSTNATSVLPISTETTPSPNFLSASSQSDIDYFFSLEDGIGELKQITTTEKGIGEIAISAGRNFVDPSCGTQAVKWKLNSKAEFKEWPWHVALLEINKDLYICGGTLISNDLVVTAAHCVHSYVTRRNALKLKVRVGEYDVSSNDENEPYIEAVVDKIFVHPGFNNATLVNDIALVKMLRPLNYTDNIKSVCLPPDILPTIQSEQPRYCVVTGWGRMNETSPFSIVLKEIVVPLWRHRECEEKLQSNFGTSYHLAETAVCAGERGHNSCDGDGGGGLVCFDEQQRAFYLQGVTSFGIGCGKLDTPGVYTNVSSYLNWIKSSIYLELGY